LPRWPCWPLGQNLVPWDVLPAFERAAIETYLREAPPERLLFLLSFALAALLALLLLIGRERRWLASLTGLGPVGLAGLAIWRDRERLGFAEMKGTMAEVNTLLAEATAALGTGGWAWIGGATVLLLLGLLDPGTARSRPQPVTASRW
jgi:hypothetical protein